MRVVVDTNIFVSALLSPAGLPAQILEWILSRRVTLLVSSAMWAEYEKVLKRSDFGFDKASLEEFFRMIQLYAEKINAIHLSLILPDPDDLCFLACALEGKADFLITGTKKHFPIALCKPIKIVSPSEFFAQMPG